MSGLAPNEPAAMSAWVRYQVALDLNARCRKGRDIAEAVISDTVRALSHAHRNAQRHATANAGCRGSSAIISASPVPTMASACSNSVMSPTAITGTRVAFFTARASGT